MNRLILGVAMAMLAAGALPLAASAQTETSATHCAATSHCGHNKGKNQRNGKRAHRDREKNGPANANCFPTCNASCVPVCPQGCPACATIGSNDPAGRPSPNGCAPAGGCALPNPSACATEGVCVPDSCPEAVPCCGALPANLPGTPAERCFPPAPPCTESCPATQTCPNAPAPTRKKAAPRRVSPLAGIELTAGQQAKLASLKSKHRKEADKLAAKIKKQKAKNAAAYEKEMKKILTPEQYAQYQANKQKNADIKKAGKARLKKAPRAQKGANSSNIKKGPERKMVYEEAPAQGGPLTE